MEKLLCLDNNYLTNQNLQHFENALDLVNVNKFLILPDSTNNENLKRIIPEEYLIPVKSLNFESEDFVQNTLGMT